MCVRQQNSDYWHKVKRKQQHVRQLACYLLLKRPICHCGPVVAACTSIAS